MQSFKDGKHHPVHKTMMCVQSSLQPVTTAPLSLSEVVISQKAPLGGQWFFSKQSSHIPGCGCPRKTWSTRQGGENGRTKAKERRYREEEIRRREIFREIRRDGYKGLGSGEVTSQAVTKEQIHFLQGHPEAPSLWVPAHGAHSEIPRTGNPTAGPMP